MKKEVLILFLKGIPIGLSNILPGISGGTIALVLNIYEDIIEALRTLRMKILFPIAGGAVVGILITANLVNYLLETYPDFITAMILGLILASAGVTVKEISHYNWQTIIAAMGGFFLAACVSMQSVNALSTSLAPGLGKVAIAGVLGSVSMLLPGISGATILVMIGMYQSILQALTEFNLLIISVFSFSALLGVLGLAWILSYVLQRCRALLMAVLSGLILGSAFAVLPDKLGIIELSGLLSGIIIVYLLSRSGKTKKART